MKKSILTNPAFRYIFEILIIVFSVTISFYIQDVINKREIIQLKDKGLSGVLMELDKDFNVFNQASKTLKARIKMGEDFLDGNISQDKLNQLMLTFSFTGQNSNYNSMVSTGVIEFISNKSLSNQLVEYYERRYDMIQDMSEQLKKLYFEFTFYMKLNYPISSMDNLHYNESFQNWSTFMKLTEFNYDKKILNKLNSDSKFRNHIYNLKRVKLYYIKFYEDALLANQNLKSLIKDELK